MNYPAQAAFFKTYRKWAMAAATTIALAAVPLGISALTSDAISSAAFFLSTIALVVSVCYTPRYLGMRVDFHQRARSWQTRLRWIVLGSAAIYGFLRFVFDAPGRGMHRTSTIMLALASLLWLLAINALQAKVRPSTLNNVKASWMAYWLSDLVVLVALSLYSRDGAMLALAFAVSAHLLLVTDPHESYWLSALLTIIYSGVLLATLPESAFSSLYLLAVASSSFLLCRISARRHQLNLQTEVTELALFLDRPEAEARKLIESGNQVLAVHWTEKKPNPDNTAELTGWYRDNALYYLGALAEYHLTYKHIGFMLDVLDRCRGRCLDFGAGNGDLALELARRRHSSVYYDVGGRSHEFAIWRARKEGLPVVFTISTGELLEEAAARGKFDTILVLDVLEHVAELPQTLGLLQSLANPGATLMLTVPFGATASHPMHLDHQLDVGLFLRRLGFTDSKARMKLRTGSELARKPQFLIYSLPAAP